MFAVRRKVILCYPEWTSKRIFMGDIQNSGLDQVKVAPDFDNLTLPVGSTNIVLRFTYYDVSSPFPSTIFILIVCSKILYRAVLGLDNIIPWLIFTY